MLLHQEQRLPSPFSTYPSLFFYPRSPTSFSTPSPVVAKPAPAQAKQNTTVAGRKAPPHYFLPQTLRNWAWQRNISPHYRACQAESVAWLESFKPFTPEVQVAFNKCDCSLIAALTFPRSSYFTMRSCCDLMHAFFVLDDHTDNQPLHVVIERCEATMDAILHVDKPRPEGEHVIGEITRQFWKRASSEMPRVIIERFEKSWRTYLDSVIRQAEHRSEQYICTPEEYMAARRDNIGAYPCFAFVEQQLELNIPHEVMEHPYIQSLNKDCAEMIILDNDMSSYKKEVLSNDADYNAITVVQKHLGVDLEGALQWLLEHHDQNIDNFMAVREKVLKKDGFPSYGPRIDREVADYVDGLGFWIRGHDEWNFSSGRYFGKDGPEVQKHRKVIIA
ncbi:putative terpene synthase family, metal binding domain [Lyophyllum shimeji]|uniref:Terpene synthase n=1 Tax=Lyophyllum shimeji TaxID=47721 RepID=A0A9P3PR11_LYOSH|nr:putative terpene synthase family, metal binding domain [Lyophyllum shimeji]